MKYTVQWGYRSAWGVLAKGEVVELDDKTAEWLQRDSPGVLVGEAPKAKRGRPPKAKVAMVKIPAKDRAVDGK